MYVHGVRQGGRNQCESVRMCASSIEPLYTSSTGAMLGLGLVHSHSPLAFLRTNLDSKRAEFHVPVI